MNIKNGDNLKGRRMLIGKILILPVLRVQLRPLGISQGEEISDGVADPLGVKVEEGEGACGRVEDLGCRGRFGECCYHFGDKVG